MFLILMARSEFDSTITEAVDLNNETRLMLVYAICVTILCVCYVYKLYNYNYMSQLHVIVHI